MPEAQVPVPQAACTRRPVRLRALTLVEVVVALTLLGLLMGGIFRAMLQSRRLTEGSIYQGTATTIANGYMEQLKAMDIGLLANFDSSVAGATPSLEVSYSIPTTYPQPDAGSQAVPDPLWTTPGAPPSGTPQAPSAISSLTAYNSWLSPSGYVDNLKSFDMTKNLLDANVDVANNAQSSTAGSVASSTVQSTWQALWPVANNYPSKSYGTADTSAVVNPSPTTLTPGVNDLHLNIWVWVTNLSSSDPKASKVFAITLVYTWQVRDGGTVRYLRNSLSTIRCDVPTY
jgi:Tfp pilus assembly protein PilV